MATAAVPALSVTKREPSTQHLPALTQLLTERVEARNRLAFVFEASHEALEPSREPPPPLSLESFRNTWQLGPRSQAGPRFPESTDALTRIKGVAPGLVKRHGKQLVHGLTDSALQTANADFVPIEPLPYATFADTRCDAWLGLLRAEICAALEVSPEHVLPARVLRELKVKLQERRPVRLSDALRGYRKRLLGNAVDEFCERQPPPAPA